MTSKEHWCFKSGAVPLYRSLVTSLQLHVHWMEKTLANELLWLELSNEAMIRGRIVSTQ